MKSTSFHILNGSTLKKQFPKQIIGDLIVTNECLVDGNVLGENLTVLYNNRAKYLSESYGGTIQSYFEKVITEFNKIQELPIDAEINLWFEEDLFCQVNFWFVLYLIKQQTDIRRVYLVLPNKENRYGFGGMNNESLIESFSHKIQITESDFNKLSGFWELYQRNDITNLQKKSEKLNIKYPFLLPAIKAHSDRTSEDGLLGRPEQTIVNIMKELQTEDFPIVFGEFCKREAIYGFGDLQVKQLFDNVISRKSTMPIRITP
ncbi:MAG: hypothetical protein ACJAS9_001134 [Polaribacter sp.]|jgi:hypothetical protein